MTILLVCLYFYCYSFYFVHVFAMPSALPVFLFTFLPSCFSWVRGGTPSRSQGVHCSPEKYLGLKAFSLTLSSVCQSPLYSLPSLSFPSCLFEDCPKLLGFLQSLTSIARDWPWFLPQSLLPFLGCKRQATLLI